MHRFHLQLWRVLPCLGLGRWPMVLPNWCMHLMSGHKCYTVTINASHDWGAQGIMYLKCLVSLIFLDAAWQTHHFLDTEVCTCCSTWVQDWLWLWIQCLVIMSICHILKPFVELRIVSLLLSKSSCENNINWAVSLWWLFYLHLIAAISFSSLLFSMSRCAQPIPFPLASVVLWTFQ